MTTSPSARILPFLVRSEKVLRQFAPEQAEQVQGLIAEVRALPRPSLPPEPAYPPLRHFRPGAPKQGTFTPQETPTRPDRGRAPRAPRAPRKRHLRLVPPPVPPPKLEAASARKAVPPDPVGDRVREAEGARALLVEIIRRAAYDWVLYRSSTRLDQKQLAEDAYTWLFQEDEDHPNWKVRKEEEKLITGFVSICDALDLNANKVRQYIKALTPNRVMSSGRPPENSRASDHTPHIALHTKVSDVGAVEGVDYDAIINQLLDFDS